MLLHVQQAIVVAISCSCTNKNVLQLIWRAGLA